jgi:Protein of unknown function DUF72
MTHWKRLLPTCKNSVALMQSRLRLLGPKLGVVLFQLPRHFGKDTKRLRDFFHMLPRRYRYAFEFREEAWYSADVFELLHEPLPMPIPDLRRQAEGNILKIAAGHTFLILFREAYPINVINNGKERQRGGYDLLRHQQSRTSYRGKGRDQPLGHRYCRWPLIACNRKRGRQAEQVKAVERPRVQKMTRKPFCARRPFCPRDRVSSTHLQSEIQCPCGGIQLQETDGRA